MDVKEYVLFEVKRQGSVQFIGFDLAYRHACSVINMTEDDIKAMCGLATNNYEYRQVPAVFNQGMPALSARLIPAQMRNLVEGLNEFKGDPEWVDRLIKEFLDIHPFADGNGRVASLLYNWLRGTLDNPDIMPYYYGID